MSIRPTQPVLALALIALAGATASGPPTTGAGADVVLARRGEPHATIVLAPAGQRGPGDEQAAALLQEWSSLLVGDEWPLGPPADGTDDIPIYVGAAARAAGLSLERIESRSREGLRVRVEEDQVLLAGQNADSTVRAAAAFLEHLGCRWYVEGDLGRHCPRRPDLAVAPVDIVDRPGLAYRRIWGAEGWGRPTLWKTWNGAGGLPLRMQHAWNQIGPEDFAEHPEWFALDADGNRRQGPWLNTGNPELRDAFAERLIAAMGPGMHPSISPPDNHRADHSPASTRYDDPALIEPSSGRVSMSNRFGHFANAIARRVAEVYPDSILGFYAYSDYSQPPTLLEALEPNICVWIAPIRYSRFHRIGAPESPSRQQLQEVIEGWSRVASQLGYRTYNYNLAESMTPFAKLSTWAHDIPYLARRGFVGISLETFPTWDLSAPTIYLSIRLAYAPQADAGAILDDFYTGFYGAAADFMREYWEEVDRGWQGLETESGSIYSVHLVFTRDRLRRLDAALTRAEQVVVDDGARAERVAMARTGWHHAADFVALRQAMHAGRVPDAATIYDRWEQRTRESIERGHGHVYNLRYLHRFIGRTVEAAADASIAAVPARRVEGVLPDEMLLAYEHDLGWARAHLDGVVSAATPGPPWRRVRTFSATLDQQGLPDRLETMWYRVEFPVAREPGQRYWLLATAIDGTSEIWINGEPVPSPEGTPFPALRAFEIEITEQLRPGDNRLALRIDHTQLRELSLGGIVGPIYLLSSTG